MTNQPGTFGNPAVPLAGAAAASGALDDRDGRDDENLTDDGVPVGEADVQADRERAGGDTADDDNLGTDGLTDTIDHGASTTDDGVPVGSADAEEDRRRASADEDGPGGSE